MPVHLSARSSAAAGLLLCTGGQGISIVCCSCFVRRANAGSAALSAYVGSRTQTCYESNSPCTWLMIVRASSAMILVEFRSLASNSSPMFEAFLSISTPYQLRHRGVAAGARISRRIDFFSLVGFVFFADAGCDDRLRSGEIQPRIQIGLDGGSGTLRTPPLFSGLRRFVYMYIVRSGAGRRAELTYATAGITLICCR